MKDRIKFLLTLIIFCLAVTTGVGWSGNLKKYLALYGTYLDYGNSKLKKDGYAVTLYGSLGDGVHQGIEAAVSRLHLNYKSGYEDLDQTDYTLAYIRTGDPFPHLSLRLGGHYISSDDELTDEGRILFGDLLYFIPYRWNLGLEVAYSEYHHRTDFEVLQLRPHAGYFLRLGSRVLYLEGSGYYIHPHRWSKLGLPLRNYYALELSATHTRGPWKLRLSGWVGQQVFAVRRAGFVVYNLREKYKGGVSGEITYHQGAYFLGLTATWNTYVELSSSRTVNQTVFTGWVGYRF